MSHLMSKEEEDEFEKMIRERRMVSPRGHHGEVGLDLHGLDQDLDSGGGSSSFTPRGENSSRFDIGHADTCGRRASMEDAKSISCGIADGVDFLAIFDGHGGKQAAQFCASTMPSFIQDELLVKKMGPKDALRNSFKRTNDELREKGCHGGTTALAVLFHGNTAHFANAGDSRAIFCSPSKGAVRCTTDHKPHLPAEEARIKALGGVVTRSQTPDGKLVSRVNGVLAVSRSLGDFMLSPYVSAEPSITSFSLSHPSDRFLVMACDGVWDVLQDDKVSELLFQNSESKPLDPREAALLLRDTAYEHSSTDNISCLIVKIPSSPSSSFSPMALLTFGSLFFLFLAAVYKRWSFW